MRKLSVVAVLVSMLAYADGPWIGMAKFKFMETAMKNTQQVGSFYFIPFQENAGFPIREQDRGSTKVATAQDVLEVLAEFERQRGLTVTTFTIERDQWVNGNGITQPTIHGIFIKAVPKSK